MRSLYALTLAALSAGAFSAQVQAQACDLSTLFASNRDLAAGGTMVFNLTVNTPVVIVGFDVNTNATVGTPLPLSVWMTPNGYAGQLLTPSAWTQIGQDNGAGSAQGANFASPITLLNPIVLLAGTYGIGLHAPTWNQRHTAGTATNQAYSNACMSFAAGAGVSGLFTGSILTPRVWNGNLRTVNASGTYADFTAVNTSGPTPLAVSFSDTSFTTAPGGVTAWSWDFNSDGIIDSNLQNPSFTYSVCGRYDVTLTASDGVNPPNTLRERAFVVADPQNLIDADFAFVGSPLPLSMDFSDTSTGTPIAWSWDLNGDNLPDSIQQNPSFTYPAPGAYNVTLTATNACSVDTERKQITIIVNDDCANAIRLGSGLSALYNNTGATTSFPWPCATGGSDLWYVYRAPCAGQVVVDLCTATDYDSALEAFSGTCASLTSLACNDDFCGNANLASSVSFPVLGNQLYYLRVGGYSGRGGNFRVNISFSSPGAGTWSTIFPACGGANLATTGTPSLGLSFNLSVTPTTGPTFVAIGSLPVGVPLCPQGCILGHNLDVVLPGPNFTGTVPCLQFLVGGSVYFQGITLGVAGGCAPALPLVTTNTLRATIG
ncbi:MAG: PKD domain-containing protein [Planctomycetes bacterium]|nr:PKD domain-containing protein [Planctomycetota bacterium]